MRFNLIRSHEMKELVFQLEQEAVQVDSLAGGNPSDNKICPSIEFTYSQDLRVQDIFLPVSSIVIKNL